MKYFLKKGPIIFSSILFLISCFVFFFVYKEIGKNVRVSEEAQIVWQTEADRRDEIKFFDRSMKAIETERILLETHFAKSSDIVPFLDTLEATADLANIKAEVSSVDIPKDKIGLVVAMKTFGSFSAIYKFLTLLENSQYELEILSLDLRKNETPDTREEGSVTSDWMAVFRIKLLSFIP